MDILIYKSEKVGYYKSYEYAKEILSKMKKITSFKAFSNEEHDYYEVIDNKKYYYNLILFDENQNEYWFDTKCGFKGMESIYSEKILNLVGIREKYNLDFEKEIHETNVSLNNELNIVSEKTIRRDIEALSLSAPIYTQAGRYGGGVYMMDGYSVNKKQNFYFFRIHRNLPCVAVLFVRIYICLSITINCEKSHLNTS